MSISSSGYRTSFILFEGMDNCGKSTQLKRIEKLYPDSHLIQFPKTLPSGALLRMNTEKDFEVLFSMFELFNKRYTYLLDRFIPSNLVYDKILRGEDTSMSEYYWKEFNRRFDVTTIVLTRPHIREDFIDDRIKLTRQQFNDALDEYKRFGYNYELLTRDENDRPVGINEAAQEFIDIEVRGAMNPL